MAASCSALARVEAARHGHQQAVGRDGHRVGDAGRLLDEAVEQPAEAAGLLAEGLVVHRPSSCSWVVVRCGVGPTSSHAGLEAWRGTSTRPRASSAAGSVSRGLTAPSAHRSRARRRVGALGPGTAAGEAASVVATTVRPAVGRRRAGRWPSLVPGAPVQPPEPRGGRGGQRRRAAEPGWRAPAVGRADGRRRATARRARRGDRWAGAGARRRGRRDSGAASSAAASAGAGVGVARRRTPPPRGRRRRGGARRPPRRPAVVTRAGDDRARATVDRAAAAPWPACGRARRRPAGPSARRRGR